MPPEAPVLDPKTGQPATTPAGSDAPPPVKPEEKPLTKDQLDGVQKFASTFLTGEPQPAKKETAEEKATREAAEAAAATTRAKPKQAKPKPAIRRAEPEKPLTADQIAEAAARGVATAMGPKKDEPAPKKDDIEYSPEETETLATLAKLEKTMPDKYKGIADRFKAAKVGLRAYAAQWEKDHPGEDFNPDDTEHDTWFDTNEPKWDPQDEIKAIAKSEAEAIIEEERKRTNERLSVYERKEKLREAEPEILKAQIQPAQMLWEQMGPEFKGLIDEKGNLNMEKAVELKKADPLTFQTRLQAASALDAEVSELYKVMNGLVDYDPKNEVHVNIGNFAAAEEKQMTAKPLEDRLDEKGRDFLPAAEYYKLSKAKQQEHWTFSSQDIAALRASHLSVLTKNLIAEEEKKHEAWATARGFTKAAKPSTAAPPPREEPEPEPGPTDDKPQSPESGAESRMTANRRGTANNPPDPGLTFLQRQLGKK